MNFEIKKYYACIVIPFLILFNWEVKSQPINFDSGKVKKEDKNSNLTFEDIVEAAKKSVGDKNFVESVLRNLPKNQLSKMPYVLFYKSQSTQQASDDDPRLIFWNKNTNLIVALNGHPDQKGGQSIETMFYDQKSHQYIFREIAFPFDSSRPIEINPERCMKCHGKPPRPIWENYPKWPGALGSDDEIITNSEKEIKIYNQLNKNWSQHPRFKYFNSPERNYEFSNITANQRKKGQFGQNTALGFFLSSVHRPYIINKLIENPHFSSIKYAFLAAVNCLTMPIEDFIPIDHRIKKKNDPFDPALKFKNSDTEINYRIKYLFDLVGINLSDLTLTFERESLSFNDGDDYRKGFFEEVTNQIVFKKIYMKDEKFLKLRSNSFRDDSIEFCEKLKELSVKNYSLESDSDSQLCNTECYSQNDESKEQNELVLVSSIFEKVWGNQQQKNGRELFQRHCSHCHQNFIEEFSKVSIEEFNKKVADSLNGRNEKTKMPPVKSKTELTQKEIDDILLYLINLKSLTK